MLLTVRVALLFYCCRPALAAEGYRPVVIVHGLFDSAASLRQLRLYIQQSHPGTAVSIIDLYDHMSSLHPMWKQVEGFRKAIHPTMINAPDGIHLICFSQGGLICRGLLSVTADHNVHSFVSLSSPQAGQYGDTDYLKAVFPHFIKSNLYRACYNAAGQKISVCSYWKDPHHIDKYLKHSEYLALLNSEVSNPNTSVWKANFVRIKKLVLIGGPSDCVISPWQSSLFGFYDEGERVVEMRKQQVYTDDTFGLRTLDARGDVVECVVADVKHTSWHSNETVYERCIDPWLT